MWATWLRSEVQNEKGDREKWYKVLNCSKNLKMCLDARSAGLPSVEEVEERVRRQIAHLRMNDIE